MISLCTVCACRQSSLFCNHVMSQVTRSIQLCCTENNIMWAFVFSFCLHWNNILNKLLSHKKTFTVNHNQCQGIVFIPKFVNYAKLTQYFTCTGAQIPFIFNNLNLMHFLHCSKLSWIWQNLFLNCKNCLNHHFKMSFRSSFISGKKPCLKTETLVKDLMIYWFDGNDCEFWDTNQVFLRSVPKLSKGKATFILQSQWKTFEGAPRPTRGETEASAFV